MTSDGVLGPNGETSGGSGRVNRGAASARVDDFLDPDDPTLFPRLTEAQIGQVAAIADRRLLAPAEILFGQGQRETPFYVVQAGAVDIFDQRPEGERYFDNHRRLRELIAELEALSLTIAEADPRWNR